MGRINSFYCPPERWNEPFVLDSGETQHLIKVLRTPLGATVRLFDGQGRDGLFRLISADRKGALLELESVTVHERHQTELVVALGWNKAGRRDWLLEKAVELEVAGLWFWQAGRSQGHVPEQPKDSWQPKLVAAAKQCANPWLPELATLSDLKFLVDASKRYPRRFLLWEAPGEKLIDPVLDLGGQGNVLMVLGPEGGLEKAEAETLISAGFMTRSLGSRILRWETAALLGMGLAFWAKQQLPDKLAQQ
ncbi:16S rRNA (uracil(1498)-N(3))-methyltransferase [Desulfocurvibacter africanus]|uniref:Ribosomal RNA small subunit methyltransferase E n=1 Tax=Desulfocurvibacter africanus subsp. africanus str. Walvis Bay TaxID=690850 RepID=F3Z2Y2_DESAF|nr:16S rRNA (uracil(1498)-N(3))-methyltransferase [Desulfocurvibacter africanus]EGJ51390.1 Ribosomal RNA small subunit methyltransferase E [Desulfocurvibacter africanus subsp. africanus str. Walvis Bay]